MMARKNALSTYNAKRDFDRTREPRGKVAKTGGNSFVVQKHAATRLHWDFRLEMDGVLKSWAVTRGPSIDPADKRLAVRTEDHPLDYGTFEGLIPKGEYGGGTVMLWDRGTWEPIAGKSAADIEDGHLHFILHGERMKGEWLLVRMKGRPKEKRENWLLRKIDDEEAGSGDALVERALTSIVTGRSMAEIEADKAGEQSLAGARGKGFAAKMAAAKDHTAKISDRRKTRATALPRFVKPQLATLVDAVPTGNDWLHEIKYDGYRALIAAAGQKVKLFTRNGLDWTEKFAPLMGAIAALDLPPCLIDGEVVALDGNGNPDFSTLQQTLKRGHGQEDGAQPLHLFAFDLLSLDGQDLKGLPTIERKERLEALLHQAESPIHVSDHVLGAGETLFRSLCEAGQEGIISKRADAPYRSSRTRSWVKVKCTRRQEFVLVGWTRSNARGRPFASLLLAQHEGQKLVYKGKVGTGFDSQAMDELDKAMARLATDTAPVDVPRAETRGVSWIKPKLVAEIAFAEFTADGRVRHGSFLGLRADKPAKTVKPEKPAPAPVPKSAIDISSRDRVIFPETGQTKGELADYYSRIAPLMLPFSANRPISLVRCPQGRAKKCFFQKHDSGAFGQEVRQMPIREKNGGSEDYIYVDSADGLLACVQMGTIEFHGWASRTDDVEKPDRMIFDLDPDEGLDFDKVKRAARDIRDHLADIGLVSFAMLSGGKGVHVVVPLTPGHNWDTHKDFASRFAQALSAAEPDRFTATMSKAKRKGRIFIDWLRNQRGSTAILPYSARARPGAPVAIPIDWEELDRMKDAHPFSIDDPDTLLKRSKDLKGWGFAAQALPEI
ncbi:DNA ligase D [Sphingobium sp. AEW010]|uniref:DNA ligase D n=1 Tax=unclassified Sphingobium TaxID=2611147 RepID=UPI00119BF467|nr:bifunctional non-homologous end joining protein LigD [Sphingobium sp. JAI105]TWC99425.1 ATP-dependent DNA ligase LigD phosphoesterase module /ATP-dependent DNA ligase LigD polymerase module [Sphingobium sp. AEW010]TWD18550.1 ATP-dependent DNA ligase LigD phosphoesterase module /ATP-dependent DNA ligase LigD polymerase module [Sphingobium sp. AEW013]TWD21799.1 ATP-dependent DNA ligase LigD phosphoesterase module /ATP-dependent DNA ligase LigD polymerase module [Sphingobium sp. AEW001]